MNGSYSFTFGSARLLVVPSVLLGHRDDNDFNYAAVTPTEFYSGQKIAKQPVERISDRYLEFFSMLSLPLAGLFILSSRAIREATYKHLETDDFEGPLRHL